MRICLILPSFSIPQLLGNELLISFSTLQLDTSGVENTYFPHCIVLNRAWERKTYIMYPMKIQNGDFLA